MNDIRFPEPVKLTLKQSGARYVASAWEAIECMGEQWPEWARGRTWRSAYRACRDALDGWRSPREAQKAFVKAARKAGVLASGRKVA